MQYKGGELSLSGVVRGTALFRFDRNDIELSRVKESENVPSYQGHSRRNRRPGIPIQVVSQVLKHVQPPLILDSIVSFRPRKRAVEKQIDGGV